MVEDDRNLPGKYWVGLSKYTDVFLAFLRERWLAVGVFIFLLVGGFLFFTTNSGDNFVAPPPHTQPEPPPASGNFDLIKDLSKSEVPTPFPSVPVDPPQSPPAPLPVLLTPNPTQVTIPVLNVSFFPLQGDRLDREQTDLDYSLAEVRQKVGRITEELIQSLQEGSRYRGYRTTETQPYLRYQVVGDLEILEPLPPNIANPSHNSPDYRSVLSRMDICSWVDTRGVREVWLWGYHHGNIAPVESNMSMGKASQAYWNHGNFGDVSNSYQIDDMPVCEHTYTLYNYNYGRDLGEALEDHTHQVEWALNFIEDRDRRPAEEWPQLLFWGNFVGSDRSHKVIKPGCGWTHYAPNSYSDYEWRNENTVLSDCEDWKPDGTGTKEPVNCHNWYGEVCEDDGGVAFKVWWMQNIPSLDNGLEYNGLCVRNWWEFVADFDRALVQGKSLVEVCR